MIQLMENRNGESIGESMRGADLRSGVGRTTQGDSGLEALWEPARNQVGLKFGRLSPQLRLRFEHMSKMEGIQ